MRVSDIKRELINISVIKHVTVAMVVIWWCGFIGTRYTAVQVF